MSKKKKNIFKKFIRKVNKNATVLKEGYKTVSNKAAEYYKQRTTLAQREIVYLYKNRQPVNINLIAEKYNISPSIVQELMMPYTGIRRVQPSAPVKENFNVVAGQTLHEMPLEKHSIYRRPVRKIQREQPREDPFSAISTTGLPSDYSRALDLL